MKILLVSDSHGNNMALDILYHKYPKMDLYLHAGDNEASEWSIWPFQSVKGNCDHFGDYPEHMKLPIPGGYLWMQHHPSVLIEDLKRHQVRLFIYGHTHRRDYGIREGIYFVNPGAISFARDDYYGSYAIIEINEEKIDVNFYQLEGENNEE